MNPQGVSCPLCRLDYNNSDRLPRIIISCGDTLCTACITKLLGNQNSFECPYDKTKCFVFRRGIETFPVNSALMQIIDKAKPVTTTVPEPSKPPKNICKEHHEELRLFCIEDKCRVCDECLSNGHKGHHVKSFKKLTKEANEEKKRLEGYSVALEKYYKGLKEETDQGKEGLVKMVKDRFEELRWLMVKKEQELTSEISAIFEFKKKNLDSQTGAGPSMKNYVSNRLSQLQQFLVNGDLNNVISEDTTPGDLESLDAEGLDRKLEDYKRTLKEVSSSFSTMLAEQIKAFTQVEFPRSEFVEGMEVERTITDEGNTSTKQEKTRQPSVPQETTRQPPAPQLMPLFRVTELLRVEKKNNYIVISANTKATIVKDAVENLLEGDKLSRETNVSLKLAKFAITEDNMKALFHVWRKLGDITCLKIDFSPENASDDLLINVYPMIFWKTKGLQRLGINLDRCKVSDKSIGSLFEDALCKLTDLTSLTLNLKSTEITDKSIEAFSQSMQPVLKNLHTFKLHLAKTNVTDQGMTTVFSRMEYLKSFAVDLDNTKVTDKFLESLVSNTLATASSSLEELEIGLSKTEVTDRGISKMFTEMPAMKRFMVSLGGVDLSDEGLTGFCKKTLPSMRKLEAFELYLWETKVTDQSISQLSCNMERVKRFKLYLGYDSVNDSSLQALSKNVMATMRSLEDFELSVKNTFVTDEGLLAMLVNMQGVKKFILNIGNTNTTDKWLEAFTRSVLPSMKSLESLKLYLWSTKLTDQSLVRLFLILKNLASFSLYLQDTRISDISIEEFIRNKGSIMKRGSDDVEMDLTRTGASDKVKAEISNLRKRSSS